MLILTAVNGPDKGRIIELPDNQPRILGRGTGAVSAVRPHSLAQPQQAGHTQW